ncbi:thioredoxin [Candidatus Saccharibacteria bacterium]|nr:thioredoxin [Candidatus Saccharibacteria bacterium]
MSFKQVTENDFKKEVLEAKKPVLVDFNADWCPPCQMMAKVVHELAEASDDYDIVSVNIDESPALAAEYQVSSIPCFVAFRDGKEVERQVGMKPRTVIARMVEQ